MMSKEGYTKIGYFMTPGVGLLVLWCVHEFSPPLPDIDTAQGHNSDT